MMIKGLYKRRRVGVGSRGVRSRLNKGKGGRLGGRERVCRWACRGEREYGAREISQDPTCKMAFPDIQTNYLELHEHTRSGRYRAPPDTRCDDAKRFFGRVSVSESTAQGSLATIRDVFTTARDVFTTIHDVHNVRLCTSSSANCANVQRTACAAVLTFRSMCCARRVSCSCVHTRLVMHYLANT